MCKIEGCGRNAEAQGFCSMHYKRAKRRGEIGLVVKQKIGVCEIEGCDGSVYADGKCQTHYRRIQRKNVERKCSVEGCDNPHLANGFCNKHYQRFVATGSTDDPIVIEKCSVEGCSEKHFGNGYCQNHNRRFKLYGDPKAKGRPERIRKCQSCGEEKEIWGNNLCLKCYKGQEKFRHSKRVREYNRRVKIKNGTVGKFTKQQVLDKTNGCCGICGKTIDLTLKHPNKDSFSIDHIVPISKGGSNTLDNVQAAHLICNVRKQDKI